MESPLKNNPDQQAASVQLPWIEQQQRDREALAAETDQAPPPESSDDEVLEHVHLDFTTQPVTVARTRPTAPAVAEQELLPCPFCGTEPIHVRTTDECKCRTSLCAASYMLVSRERWNRRPAAPVAVGETPAVCQICGFPNRSAYGATIECGCKKPSSTGETPETDALFKSIGDKLHSLTDWMNALNKLAKHARNLERQLAAACRERDEAVNRYEFSKDANNDTFNRLTAERDRLREENADAVKHNTENWVTINKQIEELHHLKSALATAQADIAKLCSVIAAAFAETTKPLNASVEYDARPTEGERLKKVQEILASAIDAADHGARDYQAAQAEAAADKRRLDYMLSLSIQLNGLKYGNFYLAETREGIDAALDAASATEGGQQVK